MRTLSPLCVSHFLEGLQGFAGAAAASVANIQTALDSLYTLLTGPGTAAADRSETYSRATKKLLRRPSVRCPIRLLLMRFPFSHLTYAATDISGFFSLAAEILSIAADSSKLAQIKAARDQLNAAVAQAAGVAVQANNLYQQLHMAAAAAPVVLRQALLTKSSRQKLP